MKKTYKIKGMHCNSCAMLIERDLKDRVNSVSASFAKETTEVDFDEDKISENEIKEAIEKLGYELEDSNNAHNTVEETKIVIPKKINLTEDTENEIIENNRELKKEKPHKKIRAKRKEEEIPVVKKKAGSDKIGTYFMIASIIFLIIIVYYIFFRNFQLPELKIPEIGDNAGLLLLFAAGILTGFHCISMCGSFVVSYTAKNAINGHKSFKQHLVYGTSKLFSYTLIGGIFGLIGGLIAFSIGLRGWVAILAGVFMIFYALSMFGIKFFRKFQFNPKFLSRVATSASSSAKGPYKAPLVTGLLNGLFIACGPLQAMYLYAAGTGSFFSGATSLFAFGLGTLPIMLGFGSLATVISHKTTKKILKASAIIVLILGLIMLNRGLALTGSSFTFDSIKSAIIPGNVDNAISGGNVNIVNGIQEVNMDVDATGYSPRSFVLKKDVPVKWNVNVKQLTGCNRELVMRDYNVNVNLKEGINVIEFTPTKTGTIGFSCGMGMIRGSFIVTETGQASQSEVQAATPKAGGSCGGSGGGCGCGG